MNLKPLPPAKPLLWVALPALIWVFAGTSTSVAEETVPVDLRLPQSPYPCVPDAQPCIYTDSSYASAVYNGKYSSGAAGTSILAGRDFDGDGYEDLIIGAPGANSGSGAIHVVYGTPSPRYGAVALANEVTIPGVATYSYFGSALGAGDVTGDGIQDLVVGAPGDARTSEGTVFILPGGHRWETGRKVTDQQGAFAIYTPRETILFGTSVAVGDMTGDQTPDIAVGAPGVDSFYVYIGPVSGDYDVEIPLGISEGAGTAIALIGDIDNDDYNDLAIGAPEANSGAGKLYLLSGVSLAKSVVGLEPGAKRATGYEEYLTIIVGDLKNFDGKSVGALGSSVAALGDLNRDGVYDFGFGVPTAPVSMETANLTQAGRLYLFFGPMSLGGSRNIQLSQLPSYFYGDQSYAALGTSVRSAGDIDGDGFADILIGAPGASDVSNDSAQGVAYLLLGGTKSGWPSSARAITAQPGYAFWGTQSYGYAGYTVFGAYGLDQDNDGFGEIYVASPQSTGTGKMEGQVYLLSMGDFWDRDRDNQSRALGDCNDWDNAIAYDANGSSEVCDGKDNDCDGLTDDADYPVADQHIYYADRDGDSFGGSDLSNIVMTCATAPPKGYAATADDCDDLRFEINPGAVEVCDNVDNDCDGKIDDDDASLQGQFTFYGDNDGDGFGAAGVQVSTCSSRPPDGFSEVSTDCNDDDSRINPSADEICDGLDNDCDNLIDDADSPVKNQKTFYRDGDRDGFGNSNVSFSTCQDDPPEGYVVSSQDCNDENATVYPGADEICDGLDNNCNGSVDADDPALIGLSYYPDKDGDTYGDGSATGTQVEGCPDGAPSGYSRTPDDCDDGNSAINPGAQEVCDGSDNDCDGKVDGDDDSLWGGFLYYPDADNDGYGSGEDVLVFCSEATPEGYAESATDCDDSDGSIHPGADEICDDKDNDCDGSIDDEDDSVVASNQAYQDADGDGHGDPDTEVYYCSVPPAQTVSSSDDCDDTDPNTYPSADEICDGADNDCNKRVDDEPIDQDNFYADVDGDGYGNSEDVTAACEAPPGSVSNAGDCDDSDDLVYPGALELCNGVDDNCDGLSDEEDDTFDQDDDGYLDEEQCSALEETFSLDCNDQDKDVHPDAEEIAGDGIDNNCDGLLLKGDPGLLEDEALGCACNSQEGSRPGGLVVGLLFGGLFFPLMRRRGQSKGDVTAP